MNYYYSMRKLKCIKTAFLEDIFHENDKVEQTWFNVYMISSINMESLFNHNTKIGKWIGYAIN